ncbi:MAG: hypothetical protein SF053_01645 [Bacteroidia bacterium]|nr:hypothetical protein [Bacteroidia bacterium]
MYRLLAILGVVLPALAGAQVLTGYEKLTTYQPLSMTDADVCAWISGHFPQVTRAGYTWAVTRRRATPGGQVIRLTQMCAHLPVYQGEAVLHQAPDGRLMSLSRHVHTTPARPLGSFEADTTLLLQRYAELLGCTAAHITRHWLPEPGGLRPVYRLETESPQAVVSWEILVDGTTGQEIARTDLGAYHLAADGDTTGWGRVFRPDPCTRAGVTYGTLFIDSADYHKPVFTTLMDTVLLRGLTYDSLFRLQGPYVVIEDIQSFSNTPATSTDGSFMFLRSEDQFEEVMVYYHIDTFQRYIRQLGFTDLQSTPLRADAHGRADADQSVFVPNAGNPYLLFGDGGVDDAEDADVIIHEYGHALTESAAPNTRVGLERRGLDEGIGDYLAAAYSYDLVSWGWPMVFTWDGHNEFWAGRMAVSAEMYPPATTSIYAYGTLWASTLMQIRQEAGAHETDRIMLQALYTLAPNQTLADAAALLLDADTVLYAGVHTEIIERYMCQRGILGGTACSLVGLTAPEIPGIQVARVSPDEVEIRFSGAASVHATWWTLAGQRMGETRLMPGSNTRLTIPASAGLYLLQLVTPDGLPVTCKVIRWTDM